MTKKSKVCLKEEQVDRLMNDTAKLAKGIDEDICPTVRELYIEHVDDSVNGHGQLVKKGKKKEKEPVDMAERFVLKKIRRKLSSAFEGFF